MSGDTEEIPCLGRPFRLGALYDCRSDELFPGLSLWDPKSLENATEREPKVCHNFDVITNDRLKDKCQHLGIKDNLSLNLMCGLVRVSGSAEFFDDRVSSERQARCTLKFTGSIRTEQLSLDQLGEIENPTTILDTTATHVVSKIQFGAKAFLVFDREVAEGEDCAKVCNEVERFAKALQNDGSPSARLINTAVKLHGQCYSDLCISESPSTYQEAARIRNTLPRLLGEDNAIPIKVWLHPLRKMDNRAPQVEQSISTEIVNRVQETIESLHSMQVRSDDLLQNQLSSNFNRLKGQLCSFKEMTSNYRTNFVVHLAELVPLVRGGCKDQTELAAFIDTSYTTPFSSHSLTTWMNGMENEYKALSSYLRNMQGLHLAFTQEAMEALKFDHSMVVGLTFMVGSKHDLQLAKMSACLQDQEVSQDPDALEPLKPWYEDEDAKKDTTSLARRFKEFAKDNSNQAGVAFALCVSNEAVSSDHKGATIHLYKDDQMTEFDPPSKPGRPTPGTVSHNSVEVTWSQPEFGAKYIDFYTVSYRSDGDPASTWKPKRTHGANERVEIVGLINGAGYIFRVRAESKAGVSPDSEVSDTVQTRAVSRPGKPTGYAVGHDVITMQWEKPEYCAHSIGSYTLSYCAQDDAKEQWRTMQESCTEERKTVKGLNSKTTYIFRVRANCIVGESLDSEVSEPITTIPFSPPGKPQASFVSHDAIRLTWERPEIGIPHVEAYTVSYGVQEPESPSVLTLCQKVNATENCTTVKVLTPNTNYVFKVRAECKEGVSLYSDVSEPVKTKPTDKPGKPKVQRVSHDKLRLQWSAPSCSAEKIEKYKVKIRPLNGNRKWQIIETKHATEDITIARLAAKTQYICKVCAVCNAGLSLDSDVNDSIETRPFSEPGIPTFSNAAHDSVTLHWSKPKCCTEAVGFYTVSYRVQESEWVTQKTNDCSECIALSGLTENTVYHFKVRAESNTGKSLDSAESEPFKTLPFSPPGKPKRSTVAHNRVELEWSKPEVGSENVEQYGVYYCVAMDQQEAWKKLDKSSNDEQVIVDELDPNTTYLFKVVAVSKHGASLNSATSDSIHTRPASPPGKPIVSAVTHSSVNLEWSRPECSAQEVKCYIITCKPVDDPSKEKEMPLTTRSSKETTVVDGLTAGTSYILSVCAECEDGKSMDSESSELVTTKPFNPPGKPKPSTVAHNSIELVWDKPQFGGDSVQSYTISYCAVDYSTGKWITLTTEGAKCHIDVNELDPKTKYVFKVRAVSDIGESYEVESQIKTRPCSPPGKPKASAISCNSITLQWDEPNCGAQTLKSYTVSYRLLADSSDERCIPTTCTQTQMTVQGLSPRTEYIFKVRAECKDESSLYSVVSDKITTKHLSPPGKPTATDMSHNTVKLEWKVPEDYGDDVQYTVSYSVYGAKFEDFAPQMTHNSEKFMTITELEVKTVYVFKVRAVSQKGVSPDSESSDPIETNHFSPPGEPSSDVCKVTHNSILLKWAKPEHGANNVMRYDVWYSETRSEDQSWNKLGGSTKSSMLVERLKGNCEYHFKVAAVGNREQALESVTGVPIMTRATSPPGKPITTAIHHKSIVLAWEQPECCALPVESYTILCLCQGTPRSQWKEIGNQPLPGATVNKLTPESQYQFKVRGNYKGGKSLESEASDVFKTLPFDQPGVPEATAIHHDTIQLKWDKSGEGSSEYFIIHYRSRENEKWSEARTFDESITVPGLSSNTSYIFHVTEHRGGNSVSSRHSAPITTKPLSPPGQPVATRKYHDKVDLQWSKPEHCHQRIESYEVSCQTQRNKDSQWEIFETREQADGTECLQVCNLTLNTLYRFSVRAKCSAGVSMDSCASETILTRVMSPPGKPSASYIDKTSVQLTWDKPQYGAENVVSYTIHCCQMDDKFEEWKPVQTTFDSHESIVLNNLTPEAVYRFKVVGNGRKARQSLFSESTNDILIRPQTKPGQPMFVASTRNSITIKWTKPEYKEKSLKSYTVRFRKVGDESEGWIDKNYTNIREEVEIRGLFANTAYAFQVIAHHSDGVPKYSDLSAKFTTRPCDPPGIPEQVCARTTSISLQWEKPAMCSCVDSYRLEYLCDGNNQPTKYETLSPSNYATVYDLHSKSTYRFRVCAVSQGMVSLYSELSDPIRTKPKLCEQMKEKSDLLKGNGPPLVYELPKKKEWEDKVSKIAKYSVGEHKRDIEERVLMLVGATGAGKTTLINGIVNHFLGVRWEDGYRFKLIVEENQTQAVSQTKWITAYTLHKCEGSSLPYSLTIIDTPGFGDTGGIERDRRIAEQIKEFFSLPPPKGIADIHGIGFVVQASLARLTPTQNYIFDSILSTFGKDIKRNIFMMTTFADGCRPPVLDAVEANKFPYEACFHFNNSALFAHPESNRFIQNYWDMGVQSFQDFTTEFGKVQARNLQLTKEVLEERGKLQLLVNSLQPRIRAGLLKIEELQQVRDCLERNKGLIEDNKGFTMKVKVTKQRKVDLKPGQYTTNCLECNFTCHPTCRIQEDTEKHRCWAMTDGKCRICPNRCHWQRHFNNPYIFELYEDVETKTLENLKKQYDRATDEKTSAERMIATIEGELTTIQKQVLQLIKQARESLNRLDEIAARQHPLTEVEYIDLMVESEKQAASPGWLARIEALHKVREQAQFLSKVKRGQPDWPEPSQTPYSFFQSWKGE